MTARRYRPRLGLVQLLAMLGGITGAILGGVLAYNGEQPWWAPPLWASGCALVITLIGAPIIWQRVVLDEAAGHLRYHNIGTLHRWRQVRLHDVLEVRYDDFADQRRAMVSGLLLYMRNGNRPAYHRLMDNDAGSDRGASPMFHDITAAVLRAQPRSLVDPILLDRR
ncbi:hypothetical protein [Stenotrophomonas sp. ATCM1_4]|uniref:hypothetical protein n=1 Tax=Stenotrophomonas sp. ATCM1_4 TaxID=2259330 RepID=UPI001046FDD5|nr:hypothetical protein [Stenotrophomonas sp. ATCM1_4]